MSVPPGKRSSMIIIEVQFPAIIVLEEKEAAWLRLPRPNFDEIILKANERMNGRFDPTEL